MTETTKVGDKSGKGKNLYALINAWAKIVVDLLKFSDKSIVSLSSLFDLSCFFFQWVGLRAIDRVEPTKNTSFIPAIINQPINKW